MSARNVLRSVLWNFLGTYMSRYSDYDGYWLFGFLVDDLDSFECDLLASHVNTLMPLDTAAHLATVKFADQMQKAGVEKSRLRTARLILTRLPGMTRSHVTEHERNGYNVRFRVDAETSDGKQFAKERIVFVAPHDPSIEHQSIPNI